MNKAFYSLRINLSPDEQQWRQLESILSVRATKPHKYGWIYEIEESHGSAEPVDFVTIFTDLLNGKYEMLSDMGIEKSDISVWMLYQYCGQCNMEFHPASLKKLSDNGLVLCISCWEQTSH